MKILLLHNFYQHHGGEDTVLANEQAMLAQHGHMVESVTTSNDRISGLLAKLMIGCQTPWSQRGYALTKKAIARFQPDIVHVHNFFPLLTPAVFEACGKTCTPVIMTLHNYRLICPGALLLRKGSICEQCVTGSAYQAIRYRCYRGSMVGTWTAARMVEFHRKHRTWHSKVDRFIALTDFARRKFIEGGLPSNKILVKPNFCAHKPIGSEGINRKRQGALFVGRLSPEKGIETLLQAWQNLSIPLRVAGNGPMWDASNHLNITSVKMVGHLNQEQVAEEMQRAAFFIAPSECYENFPLTIAEAFAHGLPIVASRLGAFAEIVEDGKTGLHFTPGDNDDLKSKVRWMHEHPEKCLQMGLNARRVYEEKYTPERNYKMLMSIYQNAIDEKKESLKRPS